MFIINGSSDVKAFAECAQRSISLLDPRGVPDAQARNAAARGGIRIKAQAGGTSQHVTNSDEGFAGMLKEAVRKALPAPRNSRFKSRARSASDDDDNVDFAALLCRKTEALRKQRRVSAKNYGEPS